VSSQGNLPELEARLSRDPDNQELLIEVSRHYHRMAMQGDEDAFDRADQSVRRLLKGNKKNVEGLSISGSLLTIKARRTGSLLRRVLYSFKAARTLDKAVKLDPANVSARTIRAFTALVLPGFLKRLRTAATDFEYLLELKSDDPSRLPDEMMPKVYLNLGLAYAKMGVYERAREVLSVVTARFPGTRESHRAQSLLAKIEQRTR
jgi:tetratricopeptide (TPR) repeat protein